LLLHDVKTATSATNKGRYNFLVILDIN
jgi:hypothetical protein